MNNDDPTIPQALSAEDEAFLQSLDEDRGLFEQLGDTLTGPLSHWSRFVFALTFVFTGVGAWTVWEMFQAETTRALILWTFGAWAAWTCQVMLKQWLHNRMNTLSILREVKKVEVRLARLERR